MRTLGDLTLVTAVMLAAACGGGNSAPPDGGGAGGAAGASGGGGAAGAQACSSADRCVGMPCVGTPQGCSGTWTCVQRSVPCTKDLVSFCGCDGVTFQDSSSCPSQPFMFMGSCELGISCDISNVTCQQAAPACASGDAPSVIDSCYGPCVPIQFCSCVKPFTCPDGHQCRMGPDLCG